MPSARQFAVAVGAVLVAAVPASAQDVDKSQYNLFNPTPRDLWRPLSADRPDITESPITVDAAAVQLETSFFVYAHDSANDNGAAAGAHDPEELAFTLLLLAEGAIVTAQVSGSVDAAKRAKRAAEILIQDAFSQNATQPTAVQ